MFDIEDYNYNLPGDLIAQAPESRRDSSRLLFVERNQERFSDYRFMDLPGLLRKGDLLVVNDTKVVPARLFGRKQSGGKIEILVVEHPSSGAPESDARWCLLRSSKRPRKGTQLFFENDVTGLVEDLGENGMVRIAFQGGRTIGRLMEEKGQMPLPPYIKRHPGNGLAPLDRKRYQTIFASQNGAVAAPTAGLHFTESLIEELKRAGIATVPLTLHVGPGTFLPVRSRDIRLHRIGEEHYVISPESAEAVNQARAEGRRVIAVGTTVVRTLESSADEKGRVFEGRGSTDLLITPGHTFKIIDGLITNFHLPKSSLLFLVSAFAGTTLIKRAYKRAVEQRYRFYSYGDAMLIL